MNIPVKAKVHTLQDINDISWEVQVKAGAARLGVSAARICIEQGSYPKSGLSSFWDEPVLSGSGDLDIPNSASLVNDKNLLSDFAKAISKTIQFPVNTIFAHGLGIVASAMSKSFKIEYGHSEKPINLYVVTSQPPSTGKSGVNEILSEPVHHAFDAINETASVMQKKIKIRIAAAKKEVKNAATKEAQFALEDELIKLYADHDKHIVYTYALDDATPEATAKVALKQKGIFNIISAEADAINVILGSVYSDKKANYGVFLKGWDSERHHVARAGQETMSGHVTGCIAVIAQDESIKTILAAGESGRGISERFLLVREPSFLGKRQFENKVHLDQSLVVQYQSLIFNIVREDSVLLKFTPESLDVINNYRKEIEPEMGDNGIYSNNMMRGFIGKADKQIMKIAAILHTVDHWGEDGDKNILIEKDTVKSALNKFKSIACTYVGAADDLGFTGVESEYEKVEERLQNYATKGKMIITINQLRSSIKDIKPFTGTPNITEKLKNIILPELEENHICIEFNGKIYINPHMRG
jgi:hypothetical protein